MRWKKIDNGIERIKRERKQRARERQIKMTDGH